MNKAKVSISIELKKQRKQRNNFFNPSYHQSFELNERIAHLKADSSRMRRIQEKNFPKKKWFF